MLSSSSKRTLSSYPGCSSDLVIQTTVRSISKESGELNMAAEIANEVLDDEEYADAEYRRFLKEKDKYMDFDEFCREEGI